MIIQTLQKPTVLRAHPLKRAAVMLSTLWKGRLLKALPPLAAHRADDVDGAPAVHAVPVLTSAPHSARAGGAADAHRGHRPARRHQGPDPAQPAATG